MDCGNANSAWWYEWKAPYLAMVLQVGSGLSMD